MSVTHDEIWSAIDALAADRSVSVSRLARNAGLDPTTFNRSKRVSTDGRLRWPSTESISKVLASTGATLGEMMELGGVEAGFGMTRVPVIGIAHAGHTDHMTPDGAMKGAGWNTVELPQPSRSDMVGFEVRGDSMLPVYRNGDTLVVGLNEPVSPGDRVVVRTHAGDVMVKELACDRDKIVLLAPGGQEGNVILARDEIAWMGRIRWASQ